jgi:MSHA biogenesis protein MshG
VPYFAYRGRDGNGQPVKGVLEGADSGAVAGLLFNSGVTPIEITPAAAPREAGVGLLDSFKEPKVGHVDVLLFTRQLYSLLKAGVPIMGALKGLKETITNKTFSGVVQNLRESLDAGREFSVSLAKHPTVFAPFYVSMVRVGEYTGMLDEILLRLCSHMEFEKFMREQVKAAVRYPTFVIIAMGVAIVIINVFVIPAFAKIFAGFKTELPLMTRILIGFSNFMITYWPLLLVAIVAAFFGFRAYVASDAGKVRWGEWKLKIPIAGAIMLKATLARFARSFSLALRSGVPAVQALATVEQTVDNEYIARAVERMREGVERGESVLRTAAAAGVFTPVVLQMIAVGEESGALDDLLSEVADMYQREVEYELKTLSAQIEPILIVCLGVLVLILALGVFLPLWDLGSVALHQK